MNTVQGIEYVYDEHSHAVYSYNRMTVHLWGIQATLYKMMVRCFGKEEADREFWETFLNQNAVESAMTASEPLQA